MGWNLGTNTQKKSGNAISIDLSGTKRRKTGTSKHSKKNRNYSLGLRGAETDNVSRTIKRSFHLGGGGKTGIYIHFTRYEKKKKKRREKKKKRS